MPIINGIEEEDFDYIHDQILYVYGSISKFCDISGMPYRKTLAILKTKEFNKEEFNEIKDSYKDNIDSDRILGRIPAEDRAKIRICILTSFNSYYSFSIKHKKYDTVYLSNIIGGRLIFKTKKYNEFVELLVSKYKLNLEI